MSLGDLPPELVAAFHLPSFRDHLSLEAGHSPNTIEAYQRDLSRLVSFAPPKGITEPRQLTTPLLRVGPARIRQLADVRGDARQRDGKKGGDRRGDADSRRGDYCRRTAAVSYTHLTLPTSDLV